VKHPRRSVYCKLGVAELKLEPSPTPLGLASWFELLKREVGDGKIHVSANENISASGRKVSW